MEKKKIKINRYVIKKILNTEIKGRRQKIEWEEL